jgi:hypothetical protein
MKITVWRTGFLLSWAMKYGRKSIRGRVGDGGLEEIGSCFIALFLVENLSRGWTSCQYL